ncbi:hypothetical protein LUZ60_009842 [Juncus effusus]|nr:hypothetical protein LUZ60_009842 [Juncus effusus]
MLCRLLHRRFMPFPLSFPNPNNPRFLRTSAPMAGAANSSAGLYVPPMRRLRSVIESNGKQFSPAPPPPLYQPPAVVGRGNWGESKVGASWKQSAGFSRYAYDDDDDWSDDDSDRGDRDKSPVLVRTGTNSSENVEEWRWRLGSLLRNKTEQEVVSRERKDRRDFDQLSQLADRMGLHSRQYQKVVVFSKVPLPNYRADLDDRRPQREVSIPHRLQREVDDLLSDHLQRKRNSRGILAAPLSRSSSSDSVMDDVFSEAGQTDPFQARSQSAVMEKVLRRRSLSLRNQQLAWQESEEGRRMLEFRKSLPSYKERDALLQAISRNQVVVISGETGCGKTTQLPQYILESEIEAARGAQCSIICTQPRRLSAIAVSERVAAERGENIGQSVGYKVRLEGMKGRDTRLLFCTTGILLRRLLVDPSLKGVTHVIVDEIHERGMNEDFLLIVLKELLPKRPELRLVLMSATLNAELFSSYFNGSPMIHIPGFTFPVRTHYLEDILERTGYRLTSYNQIDDYGQDKSWKMQRQAQSFKKRKSQIASSIEDALERADFSNYSSRTRDSLSCWNPDSIGFNLIESLLCHICQREGPGAILVFMTGWDDINSLKEQLVSNHFLGDPSRVLLLTCHGSMSSAEQKLIFERPEEGIRKIVLATNLAETSITINDVVYVIDCGKAKETSYDALNNTPCLLPTWISKASARQRRGRAGRVQAGECFHLYPKCVYDSFADYQLPELLRTPLQSLCLQIKSLKLGSIKQFLSRALQSPESLSVQNAIEYLQIIGALDENEELTLLGRHLSMLPVEPKLGKMLIYGAIFNCLDPILTIVAGLSVRDPFLTPFDKKEQADSAKMQYSKDYSDHLALVRAYEGWRDAEQTEGSGYNYCWRNFLSFQTLRAIDSLKKQFLSLLKDTGLVDEALVRCNKWSRDESLVRAVICAGLYPGVSSVVNKEKSITLKTMEDGQVMLYMNSVNGKESRIPYPWLVFNEKVKVNSVFLRDSTGVPDSVLLLFGGKISQGPLDGHLKMLGGYLEFFMSGDLASLFLDLKAELQELIQSKLQNPRAAESEPGSEHLVSAIRHLVSSDPCTGRFVYGRQEKKPKQSKADLKRSKGKNPLPTSYGGGGDNPKSQLQTLLIRAGKGNPVYKCKQLRTGLFRSSVEFNGMQFVGEPCGSKKEAEKDAASEALNWLIGGWSGSGTSARPDLDQVSALLKSRKPSKQHRRN